MSKAFLTLGQVLLVAVAAPAVSAKAGAERRVAVLEFHGDYKNNVIELDALRLLSDKARNGALEALRGTEFFIMTRETQEQLLRDMGVCNLTEGECDLETGRSLQAHYFVTGDVLKIGGKLHLSMKVFETATGRFLAEEAVKGTPEELVEQCGAAAQRLVQRGLASEMGSKGSEIIFGKGVKIVAPPVVRVDDGNNTMGGIRSIRAEEALERALETQENSRARADSKAKAWCELAAITTDNPYLETAKEGCTRWTAYSTELRNLQDEIDNDFDNLSRYLKLKRKTPEQKIAATQAFLETYRNLDDHPHVKAARASLKQLGVAPPPEKKRPQREERREEVVEKPGAATEAAPAQPLVRTLAFMGVRGLRWIGVGTMAAGVGYFVSAEALVVLATAIIASMFGPQGLLILAVGTPVLGVGAAVVGLVGAGVAAGGFVGAFLE